MKWQAPSEEELARRGVKPATDDPVAEDAQEAPKPKRKRKAKE
jgi:hypothetical protein